LTKGIKAFIYSNFSVGFSKD